MEHSSEIECPVCYKQFASSIITVHVNRCMSSVEEKKDKDDIPQKADKNRKRKSESQVGNHQQKRKTPFDLFAKSKPHETSAKNKSQSPVVIEESSSDGDIEIAESSPPSLSVSVSASETDMLSVLKPGKTVEASKTFTIFQPKSKGSPQTVKQNGIGDKKPDTAQLQTSPSGSRVSQVASSCPSRESQLTIPLPEQMRPKTLEDFRGQEEAVGRGSMLRSLLDSDRVPSIILWGPPGCGKTTLARIIANRCKTAGSVKFVSLSATSSGVNDVKEVIKVAKNDMKMFRKKTILFLDEIHRFNKTQQDSLLPHVEDGTIRLIGATTENPSFQVNTALLSRCRVVSLEKLSVEAVEDILIRAASRLDLQIIDSVEEVREEEEGDHVYIERKAVQTLSHLCDGDARVALNGLHMAVQSQLSRASQSESSLQTESNSTCIVVTTEHIKEGLQRSHIAYDRAGDEHYNIVSAMIKSMRGSDASAALYWMTRMLEGGEDPLFIARRLVIFSSEDVGLADPAALNLAVSTYQACHFIGRPECGLILAQCVVYLARAAKSVESYQAFRKAQECVRKHEGPLPSVPLHLRNAPTKLMKNMGYGKGYQYNPNLKEPVNQEYFPKELLGTNFFK